MPPLTPFIPLAARAANQAAYQPTDPMEGILGPRIQPIRRTRRRRKPNVAMTPEENTDLMRRLMGGVQWVGEAADKFGAASRGVLSGITDIVQGETPDWGRTFGSLAHAIPFSDTLGLTDPTTRVSEWELGEKWGMPKGEEGFDRWDLAKLGLGVVTDPLFWATGPLGTLTKAGKATAETSKAAQLARLAKGPAKTIAEGTKALKAAEEVATTGVRMVRSVDNPAIKLRIGPKGRVLADDEFVKMADEMLGPGKWVEATPVSKGAYAGALEKGIGATPPGARLAPVTAIEQIRQGQRALVGLRAPKLRATTFGLPIPHIGMTDEAVASFGKGEWAANVAKKLFYGGEGAFSHALWPLRTMIQGWRGTFTPHVKGFSAAAQKASDVGFAEAQLLGDAVTDLAPRMGQLHDLLGNRYAEAAKQHIENSPGAGQQAYQDFMRMAAEQMELADGALPTVEGLQAIAHKTLGLKGEQTLPELVANNNEMADGVLQMLDTLQRTTEIPAYKDLLDLGAPGQMMDDIYAFHFGRRPSSTGALKEAGKDVSKPLFQYSMARQGPLRDIPFGTWLINKITRSQVYRGVERVEEGVKAGRHATTKGLKIGQVVHALDRENYGWVWDVSKNGDRAKVHFVSREGVESDKWLDESLLVPTTGTPKLPPGKYFRKMKESGHKNLLRAELRQAGIPIPEKASLVQLRRLWMEKELRSQLDEAWATPGMTRTRLDGTEVTREEEYTRWFDGVPELSKKTGKPLKNADGSPKMVPPRINELDDYFSQLPISTQQTGLFDRTVMVDWREYMDTIVNAQSTMRSAHSLLSAPGVLTTAGGVVGEIPLESAWKAAGFTDRGLETLAKKMAPEGTDAVSWLANQRITPSAKNTLAAFGEVLKPQATEGPGWQAWNKIMAYYKGHLTLPFLSFHGRNDLSNMWLAWTDGRVGIGALAKGHWDWTKYALGFGKVDDETLGLIREGIDLGAITTHKGQVAEISAHGMPEHMGPGFASIKKIGRKLTPSGRRESMEARGWTPEMMATQTRGQRTLDLLLGTRRNVSDELAAKGIEAMPVSPLVDVGESLYQLVEGKGRAGYWLALRRQGLSPSQAKHLVDKALYDYTNLSKADRAIKKAVPFWSWRKNNIPAQLRKFFDRPAQQVAKLRTISAVGQQEEYTPGWIREQLGVSTEALPEWMRGPTLEGGQHYLTQLGMPIEDLNLFALEGGKPTRRTAEKLAAGLAPPIKAVGERFTGREFFSGRNIKDLQPMFGTERGTILDKLGFLVANSPISRYESESRKIRDYKRVKDAWEAMGLPGAEAARIKGRKGGVATLANLLTGIKSTTVEDLKTQKLRDFANLLQGKILASPFGRSFEVPYVPQRFREEGVAETEEEDVRRLGRIRAMLKKINAG